MNRLPRAAVTLAGVMGLTLSGAASAAQPTALPNAWRLTPAGRVIQLAGDMPLRILLAGDGRSALILTGGYHDHVLDRVGLGTGGVVQHLPLGKAGAGLTIEAATGRVYVSGGGPDTSNIKTEAASKKLPPELLAGLDRPVLVLDASAGAPAPRPALAIEGLTEDKRFIGGLLSAGPHVLFAANLPTDTVYRLDPATGATLGQVKLGYRPYQMALSPDQEVLAVGNWGDKSVSLVDRVSLKETARIGVGVHPIDLAFGPDGRLFVANAGSNSVSVIQGGAVTETIRTSLQADDPVGSTPDGIAVAPDGKRLYVANADNNDIAVVDISAAGHSRVLGFIPTGWYPTALAITPDGRTLIAGIAKGIGSSSNVPAHLPNPQTANDKNHPFDYEGNLMSGYAELIAVPGPRQLAAYTRQVLANIPRADPGLTEMERRDGEAAFRQIKHVLYIIRENRTYDQVLGDDLRGDGVAELAIFGREVTPNAHRLAELTPLMDRFFLNGEVSEDGHQWANAAYATAFVERATASTYGGRGEPEADDRLTSSPSGYLWDAARTAGLSYRSYAEFAHFTSNPKTAPIFAGDKGLEGHSSSAFDAAVRDPPRADVFIAELREAEQSGQWFNYMVMHLGEDHTSGLAPGKPTPKAAVASNDLALAKIVEAVSHSSFWSSTAIFVTEDDAQDGPDHVDDHRSVGLVISPYVKRGLVDHTHYTMMSIVRTIELILGLKPMTQYDLHATAFYRLFKPQPTMWTYDIIPETEDLDAVNPAQGPLAEASAKLDFSDVDRADPQALNAILWAALRPGVPYPAPVRGAQFEEVRP